jgi:hypothetical protein
LSKDSGVTGKLSSTSASDRRSSKDEAVTSNQQIVSVLVPVEVPVATPSFVRLPFEPALQINRTTDQSNPVRVITPIESTATESGGQQVVSSQIKLTNSDAVAGRASGIANEIPQPNADGIIAPAAAAPVTSLGSSSFVSTQINPKALDGPSATLKGAASYPVDGKVLEGGLQSEPGRSVHDSWKASAMSDQIAAPTVSLATTSGMANIKVDEQAPPSSKTRAIHSENVSVSKATLQSLASKAMSRASDLPISPSFIRGVEVETSLKSVNATKMEVAPSTEAGSSSAQHLGANAAADVAVNSVTPVSAAELGVSIKEDTKADTQPVSVSASPDAKPRDVAGSSSSSSQTKDADTSTPDVTSQASKSVEDQNVVITQGASVAHLSSQDSSGHSSGTTAALSQPISVHAGSTKLTPEVAVRAGGEAVAAPAALPAINTAKVIQSMGQTEMRVGMNSTEFGNISIRTSATRDAIVAQISLDHGDLAKELAIHLPEMQEKLNSVTPGNVRIDLTGTSIGHGSGTSSGMSDGSANNPGTGRQQQNDNSERAISRDAQGWMTSHVAIAAVTNDGVVNQRLDINI